MLHLLFCCGGFGITSGRKNPICCDGLEIPRNWGRGFGITKLYGDSHWNFDAPFFAPFEYSLENSSRIIVRGILPWAALFVMIRLVVEDGLRPVDLFDEDEAYHLVGKRHA